MPSSRKQRKRHRRRLLHAGVLAVAALPLAVVAALAATTTKPVAIDDAASDVSGPLDLQRVTLHRLSDGHLRAIVTFVGTVSAGALLAPSGPPGSACLRVWTDPAADPQAMRPDRLVCVTARSADELRAGVYQQLGQRLRRVAPAQARTNRSGRSFVIRITQSSLGGPAFIRFSAESTRPGCERVSCIDMAPEGGRVRHFRLQ